MSLLRPGNVQDLDKLWPVLKKDVKEFLTSNGIAPEVLTRLDWVGHLPIRMPILMLLCFAARARIPLTRVCI